MDEIYIFSSVSNAKSEWGRFNNLACLAVVILLLVSACQASNPLVGRWRSDGPSKLLYEFREDGSVLLRDGGAVYPVFRYKLGGQDSLTLFDGMGRIKKFTFTVSADQLVFHDAGNLASVLETFTRQR